MTYLQNTQKSCKMQKKTTKMYVISPYVSCIQHNCCALFFRFAYLTFVSFFKTNNRSQKMNTINRIFFFRFLFTPMPTSSILALRKRKLKYSCFFVADKCFLDDSHIYQVYKKITSIISNFFQTFYLKTNNKF